MARSFPIPNTTDYIDCGNAASLNKALSQCTISCWVKTPTTQTSMIFARDDNSAGRGFYFGIVGQADVMHLYFYCFTGNSWPSSGTSSGTFDSRTWSHIAAQMYPAAAGAVGWANGAVIQALNGTQAIPSTTGPTTIGKRSYSGVNNPIVNAALADLAFWDVKLEDNEIIALSRGVRPYNIRKPNLFGYWPLDGIETVEPDLSGNKNSGTVYNTSYAIGPAITMFTPRWPRNYDAAAATVPLSQSHFRFRTDTGPADATPTWGDAEDTSGYNPDTNKFRVRVKVENP